MLHFQSFEECIMACIAFALTAVYSMIQKEYMFCMRPSRKKNTESKSISFMKSVDCNANAWHVQRRVSTKHSLIAVSNKRKHVNAMECQNVFKATVIKNEFDVLWNERVRGYYIKCRTVFLCFKLWILMYTQDACTLKLQSTQNNISMHLTEQLLCLIRNEQLYSEAQRASV